LGSQSRVVAVVMQRWRDTGVAAHDPRFVMRSRRFDMVPVVRSRTLYQNQERTYHRNAEEQRRHNQRNLANRSAIPDQFNALHERLPAHGRRVVVEKIERLVWLLTIAAQNKVEMKQR
jgi:hypothetical protein